MNESVKAVFIQATGGLIGGAALSVPPWIWSQFQRTLMDTETASFVYLWLLYSTACLMVITGIMQYRFYKKVSTDCEKRIDEERASRIRAMEEAYQTINAQAARLEALEKPKDWDRVKTIPS